MALPLEVPVRFLGDLCLPEHSKSVPPLQARDHQRLCGVKLAGKQRRRLNDPGQVSRAIHTAVLHVAACEENTKLSCLCFPSLYIHAKKGCPSSKVICVRPLCFLRDQATHGFPNGISLRSFDAEFWICKGREVSFASWSLKCLLATSNKYCSIFASREHKGDVAALIFLIKSTFWYLVFCYFFLNGHTRGPWLWPPPQLWRHQIL